MGLIKTIYYVICLTILTTTLLFADDFYGKEFANNIIQGSYERDSLRFEDSKINNVIFSKIISDSKKDFFAGIKYKEVIVKKFNLAISRTDVEDLFGLDYFDYESDYILNTGYLEILAIRDVNGTMNNVTYYQDDMFSLKEGRYLAKLDSIGEVEYYINQNGDKHTIDMFKQELDIFIYFMRHPGSLQQAFEILKE